MSENTILSANDALNLSQRLLDAVERMPGINLEDKTVILRAGQLMAEHGCNSIIAKAVLDKSLLKFNKAPGA